MTRAVGIDLGTTNCTVAAVEGGLPRVLADDQGQVLFPSVVSVGDSGRIWTGREAAALGAVQPGRTIHASKRLIGRSSQDPVVQRAQDLYPYRIVAGPDGGILLDLGEVQFSPEQVAGQILSALKKIAGARLGEQPTQAVITVPAYFNHAQREATQRAAQLAGLKALRLLNEPTAAALSLGPQGQKERLVAVYDFGGGTFDFSLIRVQASIYEVLATNGDTFLGGDDIDGLVCNEMAGDFERQTGIRLHNFPLSWYRLRDAAQRTKMELSRSDSCAYFLPRLVGEDALTGQLSRSRLEELARPLLDRSLRICQRTLEEVGIRPDSIDEVLLVGGQTRMPLLRRMVEEFFGRAPSPQVNPDTAVAEGAAREAALLQEGSGALLLDVTPMTLGINIFGNRLFPLVPRNSKVPLRKEHVFTTHRDGQHTARMTILQGDHPVASENFRLGEVTLENLSGAERFQPRIRVAFEIDRDGILHIKAVDEDTRRERELTIRQALQADGRERAQQLAESTSLTPADKETLPLLAGPFRETELVDVLCFLHANRRSGRLTVEGQGAGGKLQLQEGEIVQAAAGAGRGREALSVLLGYREGRYAFFENLPPEGPPDVQGSFQELIK